MKKLGSLFSFTIFLTAVLFPASAQVIFTKPLSNRIANYTIHAVLDTETKKIDGTLTLTWKNTSKDTISDLFFHAYMNAFKNSATTFMRESGGQLRGDFIDTSDKNAWGWLNILKITDDAGTDYTSAYKYVSPDDGNEHDQSVFRVPLSKRILPNEVIKIHIDFETKLPKIFARTGYEDNYFMIAQWFPKIGVYEQGRGWNCHQFHAHSEFYADFGVYDVELTLPKVYIVGASGGLQSEKIIDDSLKIQTWRAEDVIDFAWTASQYYIEKSYKRKDVTVRILLQPEHLAYDKRHSDALEAAMSYFEKYLGEYPYKHITVIDPPVAASGAGGMEYPTLITAGTYGFLPKGVRTTELVVIHEYGHQYFMGLLASNEFEEAWLDEGINSYFESRIMDETYGIGSVFNVAGFTLDDWEMQRLGYTRSPHIESAQSYRKAWEYPAGGYSEMSYQKPATFLTTYERMVGRNVMDEIMKTYYERFKFEHPKTSDFLKVVKEITQKYHGDSIDSDKFFRQTLYQTSVCDYFVKNISSEKIGADKGWFSENHADEYKIEYGETEYKSFVTVVRKGDLAIPTELLVTFSDGATKRIVWNGDDKFKTFSIEYKHPIISAQLDPRQINLMDTNLNNNSYSTQANHSGIWKIVLKIMFFLQNLMQSIAFFA